MCHSDEQRGGILTLVACEKATLRFLALLGMTSVPRLAGQPQKLAALQKRKAKLEASGPA